MPQSNRTLSYQMINGFVFLCFSVKEVEEVEDIILNENKTSVVI